jgi:hypothetical protein
MRLKTFLQCHHQAVGEEGDEDVRLNPVFKLMMNGSNGEIALECSEDSFNLGKLDIAFPGFLDPPPLRWTVTSSGRLAVRPA